nr:PRC-barrel domain-containing protein [uncultured Halomonas sp.]
MKTVQILLFCALLIPTVGFSQEKVEKAQDQTTKQQAEASASSSVSSGAFMEEQQGDQVRSDQLVGSAVTNASDEEIGNIDDLLLNKEGQVVGIIVGVGGFLGIGEKHVALSWDAVEITRGEGEVNYKVKTNIDKAALEEATAFKTEERKQAEQLQEQRQQQAEQQLQQPAGQQPPVGQPQPMENEQ